MNPIYEEYVKNKNKHICQNCVFYVNTTCNYLRKLQTTSVKVTVEKDFGCIKFKDAYRWEK